jgi:hypothetical protein
MDNEQRARDNLLRKGEEVFGNKIEGYNFDSGVNFSKIIESYANTGFQATNFSKAIQITNKMISQNAFIFLGYTSNMVSSGLRDVFRYLVKNKSSIIFNCGYSKPISVIDVLNQFENALNHKIKFSFKGRRLGDIEKIYSIETKNTNDINNINDNNNNNNIFDRTINWIQLISEILLPSNKCCT